jgi:hypothetical protein
MARQNYRELTIENLRGLTKLLCIVVQMDTDLQVKSRGANPRSNNHRQGRPCQHLQAGSDSSVLRLTRRGGGRGG